MANCKYLFNYYTEILKPGPSLLKLLINFQVYIPLCMGFQILRVWYHCLLSTCSRQSCLPLPRSESSFPLPILPILSSGSSPQPCNLLYSREHHSPEPLLQNWNREHTFCIIAAQSAREEGNLCSSQGAHGLRVAMTPDTSLWGPRAAFQGRGSANTRYYFGGPVFVPSTLLGNYILCHIY